MAWVNPTSIRRRGMAAIVAASARGASGGQFGAGVGAGYRGPGARRRRWLRPVMQMA